MKPTQYREVVWRGHLLAVADREISMSFLSFDFVGLVLLAGIAVRFQVRNRDVLRYSLSFKKFAIAAISLYFSSTFLSVSHVLSGQPPHKMG